MPEYIVHSREGLLPQMSISTWFVNSNILTATKVNRLNSPSRSNRVPTYHRSPPQYLTAGEGVARVFSFP
jgi:hypothetical protein